MSDYKDAIQAKAEESAWDTYGKDFYELSPFLQEEVYRDAMGDIHEQIAGRADYFRKAERERG